MTVSVEGPRAGVIGWPVAHSRSPAIHGFWLRRHGLPGRYERLGVPPEDIRAFLSDLPRSGLVGGNVTLPHKEAAFRACAEIDDTARAVGAVNTLWLEGSRLCGANTDVGGFLASLDAGAPGWDARAGPAMVLGAGGAARAVAYALSTRGFAVRLVNRTTSRAEDIAARIGGQASAHGWDDLPRLLGDARLLVNTTSLGMTGHAPLEIDLAALPPDAVVTDIVYAPLETALLAAARARGHRVVDGLGMLLHQAVPGFQRWFGVRPEVTDALRAHVLADMARV